MLYPIELTLEQQPLDSLILKPNIKTTIFAGELIQRYAVVFVRWQSSSGEGRTPIRPYFVRESCQIRYCEINDHFQRHPLK